MPAIRLPARFSNFGLIDSNGHWTANSKQCHLIELPGGKSLESLSIRLPTRRNFGNLRAIESDRDERSETVTHHRDGRPRCSHLHAANGDDADEAEPVCPTRSFLQPPSVQCADRAGGSFQVGGESANALTERGCAFNNKDRES